MLSSLTLILLGSTNLFLKSMYIHKKQGQILLHDMLHVFSQ